MIKRIKSLISVKNLTASQFADLLGVQRSNISHIFSGRNKPSLDFILKITEHFPSVSIEWLINGKGEMFRLDEKDKTNKPSQLEIPSLDEDAVDTKDKPKAIESEKKIKEREVINEVVEDSSIASPEIKKQEVSHYESSSNISKEVGIEQIMIFYINGTFRIYKPQN